MTHRFPKGFVVRDGRKDVLQFLGDNYLVPCSYQEVAAAETGRWREDPNPPKKLDIEERFPALPPKFAVVVLIFPPNGWSGDAHFRCNTVAM